MAELDLLKALRINAFHAVKYRDHDYVLRHIQRWYSREFTTPLREVEDIAVEDLLQHYFECRYEGMEDEDLDHELMLLVETDAEREAREGKEKADSDADDAFFEQMAEKAKRENKKVDATPIIPVKTLGSDEDKAFVEPEAQTENLLPENVKAAFMDDADLEDLDSWDVLGPPPAKDRDKTLGSK